MSTIKKAVTLIVSIILIAVGGGTIYYGLHQPPPPTPDLEEQIQAFPGQKPVGPQEAKVKLPKSDPKSNTEELMTPAKMGNDTLFIPALGIYTEINTEGEIGTIKDSQLVLPEPSEVTRWVDGPNVIDEIGATIVSGHITYNGENGSLYNLSKIKAGNLAYIKDSDGNLATFQLYAAKNYKKAQLPQEYFNQTTATQRSLVVITCGGELTRNSDGYWHYDENTVAEFRPVTN